MDGVSFSFFQTKFLVLAVGPSRGAAGRGVGFRCWADAFGWFLSFPGLLSGQSAVSGAWPWIGLNGPGEGLGASLIISLMLCNYLKF